MNIFTRVKEFIMSFFKSDAENDFNTKVISSELMEIAQAQWENMIKGSPFWLSDTVKTINFAKYICTYSAKKACLDLRVSISGSPRADYINSCIKNMVDKSIRDKVEDALGLGGIIIKPSGTFNVNNAIDYVMPGNFAITEKTTNGDILGIIFIDRLSKGDEYFFRLEYHHFVDYTDDDGFQGRNYAIENKAYKSRSKNSLGKQILLTDVPEWAGITPVTVMNNVEKPLFGYIKTPANNVIDYNSPEGVAIFSNAIEELRDLDVAWSRKSDEAEDSQHITFIDENALMKTDKTTGRKERIEFPRFVKGLRSGGVDKTHTIDEHTPNMITEQRIADINSILSMISTKCGFSQGQFVLDRKTGMITATQVESDDLETVETITDIRVAIKSAVIDLVYALNKYCDVFFNMPDGYVNALDESVPDEDIFYFKDLLATFEQDRTRAYQLMIQGRYSMRKYLKEYEGFSDSEVDEMMEEIRAEKATESTHLFVEE